ncbi:uncharacterized protein LOC119326587 [Triticum dicoccoides]|uniref:uncharacterized protein LOC119326587 n=1 Tax=Triticum dicoccoides TaxID=85692 RepID=UPI001891CD83|nr:uncharacterized protein LOC119326587 [Triticum dicoccoides]
MSAAKHCHERACSRQATSPVETGLVVGEAADERRAVSCPPWQDIQQASDVVVCREPATCLRRSYAVRWGIDLAKEKLGPRGCRSHGGTHHYLQPRGFTRVKSGILFQEPKLLRRLLSAGTGGAIFVRLGGFRPPSLDAFAAARPHFVQSLRGCLVTAQVRPAKSRALWARQNIGEQIGRPRLPTIWRRNRGGKLQRAWRAKIWVLIQTRCEALVNANILAGQTRATIQTTPARPWRRLKCVDACGWAHNPWPILNYTRSSAKPSFWVLVDITEYIQPHCP